MNLAPVSTMVLASVAVACLSACAGAVPVPASSDPTLPAVESMPTPTVVIALPSPRSPRPLPSDPEPDPRILARLPVGPGPVHLAIGVDAIWVANGDTTVTRIDPTTGNGLTITVPGLPGGVAADATGAWVAINRLVDGTAGTMVVQLHPATGAIVREVVVPEGPRGVALGGGAVWVASGLPNVVSRIDPDSGEIVATIPVEGGPAGVRIVGDDVWVASRSGPQISRIDPGTNAVAERVELGGPNVWLAGSDTTLWVASWQAALVYRVDRSTGKVLVAELDGPVYPGMTIVDGAPWVPSGTKLVRLDPATAAATEEIDFDFGVGDVEATEDGQLWVLVPGASELLRVQPDS